MATSYPYFPFYAADWLADESVLCMTIEDEGCYIRLLAVAWREGSIPADAQRLQSLCKNRTLPVSEIVTSRFVPHDSEPGRLVHPRLEIERAACGARSQAASKSAKEGVKTKQKAKKEAEREAKRLLSERSANAQPTGSEGDAIQSHIHIQSHIQTPTGNMSPTDSFGPSGPESVTVAPKSKPKKKTDPSPEFEAAWIAYDRKGSKAEAWKRWQTLAPDADLIAVIMADIPVYHRANPDPQFRKDFERYISGAVWEAKHVAPASPVSTEPENPYRAMFDNFVPSRDLPEDFGHNREDEPDDPIQARIKAECHARALALIASGEVTL